MTFCVYISLSLSLLILRNGSFTKVLTPPAPKSVIQRAIDKGILTPFEANDFTTSANMKIHKPKKYKHHYLKPTCASEARNRQWKDSRV